MWHHHNYEAAAEMRKKYIPIEKVLTLVDPGESDVIMDVGGGDGYYSTLFAEKCRKVYYVDPSNPAVNLVKRRLSGTTGNIEIMQEDICTMKLPDDISKVFFSNSFHDIGCRENLIGRLSEASVNPLKCILIEFKKEASIGPPEYVKIDQDELDNIFGRNGYHLERREVLLEHYVSSYIR